MNSINKYNKFNAKKININEMGTWIINFYI